MALPGAPGFQTAARGGQMGTAGSTLVPSWPPIAGLLGGERNGAGWQACHKPEGEKNQFTAPRAPLVLRPGRAEWFTQGQGVPGFRHTVLSTMKGTDDATDSGDRRRGPSGPPGGEAL